MSIAARILEELGFVPVVPAVSRVSGTAESKAGRHVPAAPVVPAQKYMEQREAPEAPQVPQAARSNVIPLRRAVTCASCANQQTRADTSPAGMHGCSAGHGLHYAGEPHACADWKARP